MEPQQLIEEILAHRAALIRARAAAGSHENLSALKHLIDSKQAQYEQIVRENDEIEASNSHSMSARLRQSPELSREQEAGERQ